MIRYGEAAGGVAVLLLGVFVLAEAWSYPVSSTGIGPGSLPRLLAIILILLSLAILVRSRGSTLPISLPPVRPLFAVTAGVVLFALLVRPAGLVTATFGLGIATSLAEPLSIPRSLFVGVVVSIIAYSVFIWALGLPIRAFWV